MIVYAVFLVGSLCFVPFAYIRCVIVKFQGVMKATRPREYFGAIIQLFLYMAAGVPMLVISLFYDCYFFWTNNFRSNLKKIIIVRKPSTLTNLTIRQTKDYCSYFSSEKIKSVFAHDAIKQFRKRFKIKENI